VSMLDRISPPPRSCRKAHLIRQRPRSAVEESYSLTFLGFPQVSVQLSRIEKGYGTNARNGKGVLTPFVRQILPPVNM
jgi:hypothetical protein